MWMFYVRRAVRQEYERTLYVRKRLLGRVQLDGTDSVQKEVYRLKIGVRRSCVMRVVRRVSRPVPYEE